MLLDASLEDMFDTLMEAVKYGAKTAVVHIARNTRRGAHDLINSLAACSLFCGFVFKTTGNVECISAFQQLCVLSCCVKVLFASERLKRSHALLTCNMSQRTFHVAE